MKKVLFVLVSFLIVLFASSVYAADVNLTWDVSSGATGYKIYQTVDNGLTWDAGVDVGNVTVYTKTAVPDSGLVLFRVSAYNAQGEAVRSWSGAWYNGDWKLDSPSGAGIE